MFYTGSKFVPVHIQTSVFNPTHIHVFSLIVNVILYVFGDGLTSDNV